MLQFGRLTRSAAQAICPDVCTIAGKFLLPGSVTSYGDLSNGPTTYDLGAFLDGGRFRAKAQSSSKVLQAHPWSHPQPAPKELAHSTAEPRERFVAARRRLELELKQHAFTEAQQSALLEQTEALYRKVITGKPTLAQKREFLRTLDLQATIVKGHQKMNVAWILGEEVLPIEYTSDELRVGAGSSREAHGRQLEKLKTPRSPFRRAGYRSPSL